MGVVERVRHLGGDAERLLDRQRAFPCERSRRLPPVTTGMTKYGRPPPRPNRAGAGCGDGAVGRDGDLAEEALRAEQGRALRPDDLDGDVPAVLQVPGQEDDRHPPGAKLPFHGIAAGQRRRNRSRGSVSTRARVMVAQT